MKVKEIMIILAIVIVLLMIIIIGTNMKKGNKDVVNVSGTGIVQKNEEEFVDVKIDGTKVNTSNQFSKTKIIDGLEISNIRLTEKGNVSQILADVKNPTDKVLGDFQISITLLDKNGNELARVGGYIDKVEGGQTVQLNSSITVDVANAYDFKVSKE